MLRSRIHLVALASILTFSSTLAAQNSGSPPGDSAGPPSSVPKPAPAVQNPTPSPLPFAFSGVLYLNYQYGGPKNARSENRFDMDRAYLNFRASSGTRDSVRVTLDVFQQRTAPGDSYYRGWTMRVKYAFLQHDFVGSSSGGPAVVSTGINPSDALRIWGRIGLLQTVVTEKEEQFWQRGLSQVATETAGYFSSADAGVALGIALPNRMGEVYSTIVNGSNYSSRETDRYKDFATRLTLSPWAKGSSFLKNLQLSPWFSIGGRSSDFVTRRGTVQPVAEARRKHRIGFLTTYRDARFVLGAHLARRLEEAETADTTRDVAPTTRDVSGNLTSVFAFWRPLATTSKTSPWSLLGRVDNVKPDDASPGTQRRYIVGTQWDISSRTSMTVDVQSVSMHNGLSGVPSRTYFLHFISNF